MRGRGIRSSRLGSASKHVSVVTYSISGNVVLAGVIVTLGEYSAVSGAGGDYTITGIPAGTSGSLVITDAPEPTDAIEPENYTISSMVGNLTGKSFVLYGPNLLSNGDMETGSPPTGWWVGPDSPVLTTVADQNPSGVGTKCLDIQITTGQPSGTAGKEIDVPLQSGHTYKLWTAAKNAGAGWFVALVYAASFGATWGQIADGATADWGTFSSTFVCTETGVAHVALAAANTPGTHFRFDDVVVREVL